MYVATLNVKDNEHSLELLAEAFHIMVNLRAAQIYYVNNFGGTAKNAVDRWEAKADKFLERTGIDLEALTKPRYFTHEGVQIQVDKD